MKSRSTWLGVVVVAFVGVTIVSGQVIEKSPGALPAKPRFILRDHKDVVWCAAFAPDGKSLVTCAGNRGAVFGELRGYDLTTGKPIQTFLAREPHGIRWVAIDPTGKLLATAEYDGMVRIRDAATGKVQSALFAHAGGVQCLKFTRMSRSLVTCGKDKRANVWDLATNKVKTTMVVDTNYVYTLDVSPDERTLLTGANEPKAYLWDMATGERKRIIPGNRHAIEAVRFSPDGKLYVTAGWDGIVNVWDAATGARLHALGGPGGGILALAFTADGKYLVAGTEIGCAAALGRGERQRSGHDRGPHHQYSSDHVLAGRQDDGDSQPRFHRQSLGLRSGSCRRPRSTARGDAVHPFASETTILLESGTLQSEPRRRFRAARAMRESVTRSVSGPAFDIVKIGDRSVLALCALRELELCDQPQVSAARLGELNTVASLREIIFKSEDDEVYPALRRDFPGVAIGHPVAGRCAGTVEGRGAGKCTRTCRRAPVRLFCKQVAIRPFPPRARS